MNLFALSGLSTGITSLSLTLFVFLKQRKTVLNRIWIFLTFLVAIWGFGCYKMASTADKTEAFLWYRLAHIGVTLIPVFTYLFTSVFLDLKKKIVSKIICFIGSIFVIANLVDLVNSYFFADKAYYLMIAHMKWIFNSFYMDSPPGPIYSFFVVFFFAVIGNVYYELFKALKENTGTKKAQIKYFFLATLVGFIGGGSSFLPVFNINVYPIGNFATATYPLVITYAILAHQLMDIEVVIKKTIIFATLFTIFFGIIVGITVTLQELLAGGRLLGLAISSLIIIFSVRPLEDFLVRVTDKYLFQKKYDYKHLIRQFMDELKTMVLNAQDIAQSTLDFLNSTIHPTSSALLMHNKFTNRYEVITSVDFKGGVFEIPDTALVVKELLNGGQIINISKNNTLVNDESKKLNERNIEIIVPLLIRKDLIGMVCLGKKKSDEGYTDEDIDALSDLSGALAIAMNNAQLFDERADAEKRAMIGTLATGINHEIGNPLNIINIKLQSFKILAEQKMLDKKSKEDIIKDVTDITETCLENTQRIAEITKKVSEFAKPNKTLALDKVDVSEAIDESISILKHELVLERINFKKEILCKTPHVLVDRGQLKQIIFNLVKNAVQAINKENGEIAIKVSKHNSGEIILKIMDNGPGIPKKSLDKIFMPFYTTKEPGKGTGLGLALVNRLVERNGGRIEVQSEEGKGTVVTLIFKGACDE